MKRKQRLLIGFRGDRSAGSQAGEWESDFGGESDEGGQLESEKDLIENWEVESSMPSEKG